MPDSPNLILATKNLPKVLAAQQLSASVESVYQVPNATAVTIATATLCNTSGTTRTVTVHVVKAAQSATNGNKVAIIELAPGESCVIDELIGLLLGPADGISVGASAASSVAIVLSGAVSS